MRRTLLAIAAAFLLSACASVLEGAYEDEARRNCERDHRGVERAMC